MKASKRFYLILIASQAVLCVIFTMLIWSFTQRFYENTRDMIVESTLNTAEIKLKERVGTTIAHIETNRDLVLREVTRLAELSCESLTEIDPKELPERLVGRMRWLQGTDYGHTLMIFLRDTRSGTITHYQGDERLDVSGQLTPEELEAYAATCPVSEKVTVGWEQVYFLAGEDALYEVVLEHVYTVVHNAVYGENGYVWVNQVLNYEGGDNYALRLIHPNLIHTEGAYLSTNTPDIAGELPYLAELEGVREYGEITHTYYFKNKADDRVMEKLSYAQLYEPFDWIISTGEPLADLYAANEHLFTASENFVTNIRTVTVMAAFGVFLLGVAILVFSEYRHQKEIDAYVKFETTMDPMTGAYSRKSADNVLRTLWKQTRQGGDSPMVMMLDLDNFKKVNDTYGHNMGDVVLKETVRAVLNTIRGTDYLFRWGGEEFILVCNGLRPEHQRNVGEKLLRCVRELSYQSGEERFRVTVSIGSTYFDPEDEDYLQTLERADMALYHSKHQGKDRYTNWEESFAPDAQAVKQMT